MGETEAARGVHAVLTLGSERDQHRLDEFEVLRGTHSAGLGSRYAAGLGWSSGSVFEVDPAP